MMKNILINRTDAIGDTLLTLPMAQMLKDFFPGCKVYFLVAGKSKDLFLHHPLVDGVTVFPEKWDIFRKFSFLRKKFQEWKIDHYFYVGGRHLPSFVAWWARVSFRGGTLSQWPAFLFLNQGLRQKRSQVEMHEAEYNLNLLRTLGISYKKSMREKYPLRVYLHENEVQESRKNLQEVFVEQGKTWSEPYMVIHPGMTGHTLNWSSRNYGRLILQIEKVYPQRFSFVVTYTPSDEPYLRGIRDELSKEDYKGLVSKICFFDGGPKGLRNFMGVLKGASFFIGPSTGPTHLCNALEVPLVALYSPIKVQSSLRWGPFNSSPPSFPKFQVQVPDVICGETFTCAGKKCPYYECMAKIEVSKVVDQIHSFFQIQMKKENP